MSRNVRGIALEFDHSVVDLSNNATTVTTGQCGVRGVRVNTALSAHACVIQDGTTAVFTIPAEAPAGSYYNFGDCHFKNGLVVNPDDAGTGMITVIYKPAI